MRDVRAVLIPLNPDLPVEVAMIDVVMMNLRYPSVIVRGTGQHYTMWVTGEQKRGLPQNWRATELLVHYGGSWVERITSDAWVCGGTNAYGYLDVSPDMEKVLRDA